MPPPDPRQPQRTEALLATAPGVLSEVPAGAVDSLWSSIASRGLPTALERLIFVAAQHRDGTSTIAWCVALGLARHLRARVTLIEVSSTGPSLRARLGLPPGPGLSEILRNEARLSDCWFESKGLGLSVVPAGRRVPGPGELASPEAVELFAHLGNERDFLIVDAPPILEEPTARPLLWFADRAVLVLRSGVTPRTEASRLLLAVQEAQVPVYGCVLNGGEEGFATWSAAAS